MKKNQTIINVLEALEGRRLLDGNGLTGTYYNSTLPSDAVAGNPAIGSVTRVDPGINFYWGSGGPAAGITADKFSARWVGQIEPRYSETYTFVTRSDDGVRLWVNGQLVIDAWSRHALRTDSGSIALEAGKRYDLRFEYFDFSGKSVARLMWQSPSQTLEDIPTSQLFAQSSFSATAPTPGTRIQAENFDLGARDVAYGDTDANNKGNAYRATDVDIQATADSGGGYNIGWSRAGEWLEYTIEVPTSGDYDLDFRLASLGAGGKFHAEIDGVNVTGTLNVPNTGNWQNWHTVTASDIGLTAGRHILRVSQDTAGTSGYVSNMNWLQLRPAADESTPAISEDFGDGASSFTVVDGPWSLLSGGYRTTSDNGAATTHLNSRVVHETTIDGDFTLTVDAQAISSGNVWNNFAVIFGYQDANNYYFYSSNQSNDTGTNGIFKVVNGVSTELVNIASTITAGLTYQLRLEREGNTIRAYRNDTLVGTASDGTFTSGQIGLGSRQYQASFDNLVVFGAAVAPPTSAPTAPSNLAATVSSSSSINLTWNDNSTDESRFVVERSANGTVWTQVATLAKNVTGYAASGLNAATQYFFRVMAGNVVGDSAYTAIANATTQASTSPTKPDASNTGPNNPAALVGLPSRAPTVAGATITQPGTYSGFDYTGNITINADNVVLENFILRGQIEIGGYQKNITIRNFKMSGNCSIGSYARINDPTYPDIPGAKNVTVEHGEFTDAPGGAVIWGFGPDNNLMLRYLYIHDTAGDVFRPWFGGLTIEHNYVKTIGLGVGDVHADVMQTWNLNGMVMRYNNFEAGPRANAVLNMTNSRNLLIESNWFDGGGYNLYLDSQAGKNIVVQHNRWGRGFPYGVLYPYPSVQAYDVWEDNAYADNGQVIASP